VCQQHGCHSGTARQGRAMPAPRNDDIHTSYSRPLDFADRGQRRVMSRMRASAISHGTSSSARCAGRAFRGNRRAQQGRRVGSTKLGVHNAVRVEYRRHRQRRAHATTPRPLSPSAATARSKPLRLSAQAVHSAWPGAAVTACTFAGLRPRRDAVGSSRCSCDRLGIAHSALLCRCAFRIVVLARISHTGVVFERQ
jgi:hypothetical protein